MNWRMVKRLVLKDWDLLRWPILGYFVAGLLSIGMIATANKASFYFGTILLITVVITAGIHVAWVTVLQERIDHTLPFAMTLPVSPREYTMAKLLANATIFVVPWLVLSIGSVAVLATGTASMRALIPFATLVLFYLLANYCLLLTVAIVTESQAWAFVALGGGNLFLQVFLYSVARIPSIARGMKSETLTWDAASLSLLSAEVVAIVLMLFITFAMQRRKRDFI